jgi:hypothetical protein
VRCAMRRSSLVCSHILTKEVGYYLEDQKNEYDTSIYYPMRFMKKWYAQREIHTAKSWLKRQQITESLNTQNGLHFSGENAFERELRRKGVQVEKYPLPTVVATKRLHEMVILRRQRLEDMSRERMDKLRSTLKVARPSKWFDESNGPLNPHFVRIVQSSYSEPLGDLPEVPLRHSQWIAEAEALKHIHGADVEVESV